MSNPFPTDTWEEWCERSGEFVREYNSILSPYPGSEWFARHGIDPDDVVIPG